MPSALPPKVLVVDDEADIRLLLCTVLEQHGYAVLSAAGARDALAHLDRHPDLGLVICDVSMPETSGPKLVSELRAISPALRVLYISGYSPECLLAQGIAPPDGFMAKPFGLTALMSKVRALAGGAVAA